MEQELYRAIVAMCIGCTYMITNHLTIYRSLFSRLSASSLYGYTSVLAPVPLYAAVECVVEDRKDDGQASDGHENI